MHEISFIILQVFTIEVYKNLQNRKLNRQHACEYFINFLESLYVRKLASKEVILQERSFKTLIMTELNVFLSSRTLKKAF